MYLRDGRISVNFTWQCKTLVYMKNRTIEILRRHVFFRRLVLFILLHARILFFLIRIRKWLNGKEVI